MRSQLIVMTLVALVAVGCGQKSADKTAANEPEAQAAHQGVPADAGSESPSDMPQDATHQKAMAEGGMSGMQGGMGVNTEIQLDPAVKAAWKAVRLEVIEQKSGAKEVVEASIGSPQTLGSSGLSVTVDTFVPDFVMGADGIGTRSPQPNNPAAHVVILEDGKTVFDGWLFAKMRDIHPFVHDAYKVFLVKGVPADPAS